MKYGIILTEGDPRQAAEMAALAEDAGWDGAFTWDGISVGPMDTYDPWVVLAAMAVRTSRVRMGAMVTPPSRRRPSKLAPPDDRTQAASQVERWREAGATWWIESDWEGGTVDAIRRRIEAGPPRSDGR